MDKKSMLLELIAYYGKGNKSQFAKLLGITPQGLSTWISRETFDVDLIYANCECISADWLLSGEGSMLKESLKEGPKASSLKDTEQTDGEGTAFATHTDSTTDGIPLIPFDAMAGVFSGGMTAIDSLCERLYIPGLKADFVIRVAGNSMEPCYYCGDMVACQQISLSSIFFQWGRAYVIDTEQGVLIKRVRQGSSQHTITLVSENPQYPPFEIPREEILHIALVKALVRIE